MRKTHRLRTASFLWLSGTSLGAVALSACPLNLDYLSAGGPLDAGPDGDSSSSADVASAGDTMSPSAEAGADGPGPQGNDGEAADTSDEAEAVDSADARGASADAAPGCVATCPACDAPQVCCAQRCASGAGNVTASCGNPATCTGPIRCEGPQDCTSGQICCGSGTNTSPLDTACVTGAMCPSSRQLIVCRTVSDCPPPVNDRCATGSSTAYLYSTCRSAPLDSGAPD